MLKILFQSFLFRYGMVLLLGAITTSFPTAAQNGRTNDHAGQLNGKKENFSPNTFLTLTPLKIQEPIKLDGILEPRWLEGAHALNFVEVNPGENTPPPVQTEAYVLHDDENLYIAFVCHDPDIRQLRASMTERDEIFHDDFAGIIFDTHGDYQTGYEFFINPFGIQADLVRDNYGHENSSYDAVWYSEGKIYGDRWIVEARIPFKSLRFPDQKIQNWRIHFLRIYPRQSRYQLSWMPISRDNNSFFGQAGALQLRIEKIAQTRVELLPYVLGSGERKRKEVGSNGLWGNSHWDANVGFNAKYGLSSAVTLDFAYNPDFSQIEADAGQIDINNTFALFFKEKRPFFLEGSDIFSLSRFHNYIYSRTINDPLIAGKVTGKSGPLTFGFISAYDEQTPYIIPHEFRSIVVNTSWQSWNNILRTKLALGNERFIGISGTSRLLEKGKGNYNLAIDGNWRFDDNYTLKALGAFTRTDEPDQPEFSRNKMDSLTFRVGKKTYDTYFNDESFMGWLFSASFERDARHWNYSVAYNELSPGFRNDAGYFASNQYRQLFVWSGYTFYFDQHPALNRITPQVTISRKYNFDGRLNDFWITPSLRLQFKSQTSLSFSFMVVNNEFFRTKQFNRMHRGWINFWTEAWKQVSGGFHITAGKYINRRGNENDPRNPFTLADGMQTEFWLTIKPWSFFANEMNFISFDLWTDYNGPKIVGQKIIRNSSSLQMTRQISLRLIGEISFIERFNSKQQAMLHSRYFSFNPLLSYKINPFTVFYLGAHIGGEKDPYPNLQGMQMTQQNIFAKFQYLFRV